MLTGFAVLTSALALVLPPEWAGPTVAAGLTIGEWVTAAVFVWLAHRQLGGLGLRGLGMLCLRLVAASAVAAMITLLVHRVVALPLTGYPAAVAELVLGSAVFLAG